MAAADSKLRELLQPVVEALGCELWGLELQSGGKRKLLRIYIDKEDGIGVEDCERVSRQSSSILDVEDAINGEYVLEVSSPGMDRPLYELAHYEKFKGENITLKLRFPTMGSAILKVAWQVLMAMKLFWWLRILSICFRLKESIGPMWCRDSEACEV